MAMVPPPRDSGQAAGMAMTSAPTLRLRRRNLAGRVGSLGRPGRAEVRRRASTPKRLVAPSSRPAKPVNSSGPTDVAPPSLDHHRGGGRTAENHGPSPCRPTTGRWRSTRRRARQSLRAPRLPDPPPAPSGRFPGPPARWQRPGAELPDAAWHGSRCSRRRGRSSGFSVSPGLSDRFVTHPQTTADRQQETHREASFSQWSDTAFPGRRVRLSCGPLSSERSNRGTRGSKWRRDWGRLRAKEASRGRADPSIRRRSARRSLARATVAASRGHLHKSYVSTSRGPHV